MSTFNPAEIMHSTGVRHVEYHETLESTNLLAAELTADLLPLAPALVLTDQQTAGRGRGTNSWWASTGALTFSLVVDTRSLALPPERLPMMSLVTGLAVRAAVAKLVPNRRVAIKWPNDVMIGDLKVCGILTEQRSVSTTSAALVIGVGVNLNNSLATAPVDVQQRATSVFDVSGTSCSLQDVLIDILTTFNEVSQTLAKSTDDVIREVNTHHLLTGREITLDVAGHQYRGTCHGIAPNGAFQLHTGSGPQSFPAGTIVSWRREQSPSPES